MIKILLRTNFDEKSEIISLNTIFGDYLKKNRIDFRIAPPAIQGIAISEDFQNKTFKEVLQAHGIDQEEILLTTVVKTNNA